MNRRKLVIKKKTHNVIKIKDEIDNILKLSQNKSLSKEELIILKIDKLIELLVNNKKLLLNSLTEKLRKYYEKRDDIIKQYLEVYTIYAKNNKLLQDEKTEFNYYPEINDDNFIYKISLKKEFWKNKIPLNNMKFDKRPFFFKLSPQQKFVKNFISENTPYNGILLWHGVGVGKSCAAISIAENFKDFLYQNNKKILVLTPSDTLTENWNDEIFNIDKELNKTGPYNVQCTGSKYMQELKNFASKTYNQKQKLVKSTIKKYYEFMGYQKLANSIEKDIISLTKFKSRKREIDKIKYIRNRFSNRVIIMDEIHVTREGNKKKDKKSRPYLEMIARYAENTKLVLLSATPMYNSTKEIIWLLNLLLWNDKLAPIDDNLIFDKNGISLTEYDDDKLNGWDGKYPPLNWQIVSDSGEINYKNLISGEITNTKPQKFKGNKALSILSKKSRGYVSYLRGENPFTFPYKMYPNKNTYIPHPNLELIKGSWTILKEEDKIPLELQMKFYKNEVSNWQYEYILKNLNISDNEDISDKGSSFSQKGIQASNIVFPISSNKSQIGSIGNIKSCFTISKDKFKYKKHVSNMNTSSEYMESFLHINHIGKYSRKFENIFKSILSCKGIVFVFSRFILHGIKSFAFLLEENGFERIDSSGNVNNFLDKEININNKYCCIHNKYYRDLSDEERKSFKPARYIYLDGSLNKKELSDLVRKERGEGEENSTNINGEEIKVILGSPVVEQGVSFHCVREVHILDPWHHLNMLEQAAGRAIRNKSHFKLPKNKRNVTLYIHISSLPKGNSTGYETLDERIYRKAYLKKKHMSLVERQLKVNSIDCILNKKGNIFISDDYDQLLSINNPLKNIKMINSKGVTFNTNLGDSDNSIICDFQKCNYTCSYDFKFNEKNISNSDLNDDTFTEEFAREEIDISKEFIKNLYLDEMAYSENDIVHNLKNVFNLDIDKEYIYIALNEIIIHNEQVTDIYNRIGTLISRNGLYIFQPSNLKDENLPYFYRNKFPKTETYSFSLNDKELSSRQIKFQKKIKKKLKKPKNTLKIPISEIINKILSAEKYIIDQYPEYYNNKLSNKFPHIPNSEDFIKAYQQSIIERLSLNEKFNLLEDSLKRIIAKERKNEPITNEIDKIILDYFDNPKKTYLNLGNVILNSKDKSYGILRHKRDIYERLGKQIDDSINNEPIYFRLISNTSEQIYYEFDNLKNIFIKSNSLSESDKRKLSLNTDDYNLNNNKNLIIGWLGEEKSDIKQNKERFKIVNKIGYVERTKQDGSTLEKGKRSGAICGTAMNCRTKQEISDVIKYLLKYDKYPSKKVKVPPKSKTKTNLGKSLCEELELILRCKEFYNDTQDRYFYKFDEALISDN